MQGQLARNVGAHAVGVDESEQILRFDVTVFGCGLQFAQGGRELLGAQGSFRGGRGGGILGCGGHGGLGFRIRGRRFRRRALGEKRYVQRLRVRIRHHGADKRRAHQDLSQQRHETAPHAVPYFVCTRTPTLRKKSVGITPPAAMITASLGNRMTRPFCSTTTASWAICCTFEL